jgi:TRAP-type C4-dicarboxylate transport system substrate-binding protein
MRIKIVSGFAVTVLAALVFVGLSPLGTGTKAASAQTMKWNMATPYSPREFITKLDIQFAADVKETTNGEIDIAVHPAGSLFKNTEIMGAARTGQIELGSQYMPNLGKENRIFELDTMPFLVANYIDSKILWDITRPRLEELMLERGLRLLYGIPWGFQNFFFNGEFDSLADIEGKKQRAYNAGTSRLASLMGTVPTTVQATEMAQAFSTGMVDGTSTSANTGVSLKMWEFVSDIYLTNAWNPKQMAFISEELFQKISTSHQEAVLLAAAKAEAVGWNESINIVLNAPRILAENGMRVHPASDTLMQELRDIGDIMLTEWLENADDEAKALVAEYRAAVGR